MNRPEFVADAIRRAHDHDCHRIGALPWGSLPGCEQRRWLHLATAAMNADTLWRPEDPGDDGTRVVHH